MGLLSLQFTMARSKSAQSVSSPVLWSRNPKADVPLRVGSRTVPSLSQISSRLTATELLLSQEEN